MGQLETNLLLTRISRFYMYVKGIMIYLRGESAWPPLYPICVPIPLVNEGLMTVESERKVYAMHKTSRMEAGYAKVTVKSKSQVCGMHKTVTVEKESQAYGMHKKSRMELGSPIIVR